MPPPAPLLQRHEALFAALADQAGTNAALDVACGLGGNALWLARLGFSVTAADVSDVALAAVARAAAAAGVPPNAVRTLQADLEQDSLPAGPFAAIICTYFLWRPLWPQMKAALRTGGLLAYETYTVAHAAQGDRMRRDYLLERGELATAFAGWEILHYLEDDQRGTAALLARKP